MEIPNSSARLDRHIGYLFLLDISLASNIILGHIETSAASSKLFDCATAVLACKHKVEEFSLNRICISAMATAAKASKSLLTSAFQLGIEELLHQLRAVSIFREVVHMSFSSSAVEGMAAMSSDLYSDSLRSTNQLFFSPAPLSSSSSVERHQQQLDLPDGAADVTQLCNILRAVSSIIRDLIGLLDFYGAALPSGYEENQTYFDSLLLIASKASIHLLLSKHILYKDDVDPSPVDERSSQVLSASERRYLLIKFESNEFPCI